MAQKRMFRLDVLDTDAFLSLPLSAQALYFHLNLRADDDGFIDKPKLIMRMIGAGEDDMKLLIVKRFVIIFESGVIVIKHWRMHNTIKGDRYHPTKYTDELHSLEIKENKSYTLTGSKMEPKRIQSGSSDIDLGLDIGLGIENTIAQSDSDNRSKQPEPLADVSALILNDGTEWKPTLRRYEEWRRLYGNVDINREFARMRQWCLDNPKRRKSRSGISRFITNWLDKQQNKGPYTGNGGRIQMPVPDYIQQQMGGTLPPAEPASEEQIRKIKEIQAKMK